MKKQFSFLLAVAMILSCMAFGAQAQVSDLTLLPPVFKLVSGEGETTIPCPQVGTTKTEISVTNNGTSDQSACLVLALYELGTNRLVDLDTDTQVIGASETVTLTAQLDIETLDGYECRYYVWDSMNNLIPCEIPSPVPTPYGLTALPQTRHITLTWKVNAVDESFVGFVVYRNGEELVRTSAMGYVDYDVTDGEPYTYKVAAYTVNDLEGGESNEVTATSTMEFFEYSNPDKSYGIEAFVNRELVSDGEGGYEVALNGGDSCLLRVENHYGRNCRMSATYPVDDAGATRTSYFYFRRGENSAITSDDRNLTFEITYFDNGIGDLNLQYNAVVPESGNPDKDNIAKSVLIAKRTNTNTWKKAVVSVTDAQLRSPTNLSSSDFRIGGGADTYIAEVAVCKTENYRVKTPNIDLGKAEIADGISYAKSETSVNVLNDTFQDVAPVVLKKGVNEADGWSVVSVEEFPADAFQAAIETADDNTYLKLQMENGTQNSQHQKVQKEFSAEGLEGTTKVSMKVKLPSGVDNGRGGTYNTGGSTLIVNVADTKNVDIASIYFAPNGDTVSMRLVGANAEDGEDEIVQIGTAAANVWIDLEITIDQAENKYYVTVNDGENLSYTSSEGVLCRNYQKANMPNYTGIPRYVNVYQERNGKNGLGYVDDVVVDHYQPQRELFERYDDYDEAGAETYVGFDVTEAMHETADLHLSIYDDAAATITVQYDSKAGEKEATITTEGTGGLVEKKLRLEDAVFENGLPGDADLRIKSSATLKLSALSLAPVYNEGVSADLGAGEYNGLGFTENSTNQAPDSYTVWVEDMGGRSCRRTGTYYDSENKTNPMRNKYFYFNVDDFYLYGPEDNQVAITFDYYDNGTKNIALQYNASAGDNPAYTNGGNIQKTGTNTWKTGTFILSDASLTNGQGDYHGDFRISLNEGSDPDSIDYLYISNVSVNVASKPFIANTERKETPTVYLAGDSTCADYEAGSPIIGWGTQLKGMLDTQVQNFAVPGRTTKTFLNSGSLEQIIEDAAPGDYLLIQFGHNDSMTDDRHVSLEDYRENLKYFITQARNASMNPIFLTSIRLCKFNDGVVADDAIDEYRNAMIALGEEMNVPVIDVGAAHRSLLDSMGEEQAKTMFNVAGNDTTHLTEAGADAVAEIVIEGIKTNTNVLKNFVK